MMLKKPLPSSSAVYILCIVSSLRPCASLRSRPASSLRPCASRKLAKSRSIQTFAGKDSLRPLNNRQTDKQTQLLLTVFPWLQPGMTCL